MFFLKVVCCRGGTKRLYAWRTKEIRDKYNTYKIDVSTACHEMELHLFVQTQNDTLTFFLLLSQCFLKMVCCRGGTKRLYAWRTNAGFTLGHDVYDLHDSRESWWAWGLVGSNRSDREGTWWNRNDREDRDKVFDCQKSCHDYADLTTNLERAW